MATRPLRRPRPPTPWDTVTSFRNCPITGAQEPLPRICSRTSSPGSACSTSVASPERLRWGSHPRCPPAAIHIEKAFHGRPILSDKCSTCHGPDSGTQLANLRLDDAEAVLKNATPTTPAQGPMHVMASSDIDRSALIHRITAADPERRMPFRGEPLEAREAALISRWSGQGAHYEARWSFILPVRPELPRSRMTLGRRTRSIGSSWTAWSVRDCGRPA